MPEALRGEFTIRQVLNFTYEQFRNRFEYRKRDVVKRIIVKKIRKYEADRNFAPTILFEIESKSWPQYKPYINQKQTGSKKQRKVHHEYDVVFQFDRLSVDTTAWKSRLGSGKKWVARPPQGMIKSIYKENQRWSKQLKASHRKSAPYLDAGDYNSRMKGINADFHFRCSYAYHFHNHLYGRDLGAYNVPPKKLNTQLIVFFTKHQLNVLETLMERGILK